MPRTSPIGIDGVSVQWRPNAAGKVTSVRMKVRDQTGAYQGKVFPVTSYHRDGTACLPLEAKNWSTTTRAGYLAGKATAGTCDIQDMGTSYCKAIRDSDCSEGYVRHIEQTVEALAAAGIRDMK